VFPGCLMHLKIRVCYETKANCQRVQQNRAGIYINIILHSNHKARAFKIIVTKYIIIETAWHVFHYKRHYKRGRSVLPVSNQVTDAKLIYIAYCDWGYIATQEKPYPICVRLDAILYAKISLVFLTLTFGPCSGWMCWKETSALTFRNRASYI
jgi:hypothetical protein